MAAEAKGGAMKPGMETFLSVLRTRYADSLALNGNPNLGEALSRACEALDPILKAPLTIEERVARLEALVAERRCQ